LRQVKEENRKIIYLDEINFTKRSVTSREWSHKNSNLTINQNEIFVGYRSVIASMTESDGIGFVQIRDEAITSLDFVDYLKKLQ